MARTNKYTSLNFNDIYEKKITTHRSSSASASSTAPSSNKTILSNSRIHGNMLVLTRPSPKPFVPPPQPSPKPLSSDQSLIGSDSISLRPLGRTGAATPLASLNFPVPVQVQVQVQGDKGLSVSPKSNKFVPPHLRPGFHGKEEKLASEIQKQIGLGNRSEGRPKSGSGYERIRGTFEGNQSAMNRPRSSGSARPYSSG